MEKEQNSARATALEHTSTYRLEAIYIYPIKSLGGISCQQARLKLHGLQYDRRWMLVDAGGQFISQREYPILAQLGTAIDADNLLVFEKHNPKNRIHIPLVFADLPQTSVQIWSNRCRAYLYDEATCQWFSDFLHQRVRLVRMPDEAVRYADGRYAPPQTPVSFADGFPYLLIGQASLDDLNRRLAQPIPMNRFRPNFIFSGGLPYEEDTWRSFYVGNARFLAVKPCARCIVVTIDQQTGAYSPEPLQTLATYRQRDRRILFGQNVVWTGEGNDLVCVGMELTRAH
ncbi:MAG: MOSC domain-containing protein [Saprospiraceae bacterium]|nr:MOSC domain-containing protein [Saprospiraceae bacterium]MDW8484322.1 MOSC domain-containing protein [Saprospiraceae bacterium]